MQSIILGGGCFWCLDAPYRRLNGVTKVTSGYAGGDTADPNYYTVMTGQTGHAEVVQIEFDPERISLKELLEIFFILHNPTTPNRQGNDAGSQYRSIILYADSEQRGIAQGAIQKAQINWDDPIVTELKSLDRFYPAEEEHQEYYERNSGNPYCSVVITPKLAKLRAQFASKLR